MRGRSRGRPRPSDRVTNLDGHGCGIELRATVADQDLYGGGAEVRQRREEQERARRENGEMAVQ